MTLKGGFRHITNCPKCGGDLMWDCSDKENEAQEHWFYCNTNGCDFDCAAVWDDDIVAEVPGIDERKVSDDNQRSETFCSTASG